MEPGTKKSQINSATASKRITEPLSHQNQTADKSKQEKRKELRRINEERREAI